MIFVFDEEEYNNTHYCLYEPLDEIRFYSDYSNYNLRNVTEIENVDGMVPFIQIREVDVMRHLLTHLMIES